MAYIITEYCTACGECASVCPNDAIVPARPAYVINPFYCVECLGYSEEPQCAAACPVGAIVDEVTGAAIEDA